MKLNEIDEKKIFLMSYQQKKKKVKRLEEQLIELQHNKVESGRQENKFSHGAETRGLCGYAAELSEIERELLAARYGVLYTFQSIQECIESMEDEREKDVLTYRYLCGLRWEEVAERMGYSWQHIHKIHCRALKDFNIRFNAIA